MVSGVNLGQALKCLFVVDLMYQLWFRVWLTSFDGFAQGLPSASELCGEWTVLEIRAGTRVGDMKMLSESGECRIFGLHVDRPESQLLQFQSSDVSVSATIRDWLNIYLFI